MLSQKNYLMICKYIAENDRNSDILDFYQECELGEASFEALHECLVRIMSEWLEDIALGFSNREKQIYYLLSIDITEYE